MHLPTIAHQGKSKHGLQAAKRNRQNDQLQLHITKKLRINYSYLHNLRKKNLIKQSTLRQTSRKSHNNFKYYCELNAEIHHGH